MSDAPSEGVHPSNMLPSNKVDTHVDDQSSTASEDNVEMHSGSFPVDESEQKPYDDNLSFSDYEYGEDVPQDTMEHTHEEDTREGILDEGTKNVQPTPPQTTAIERVAERAASVKSTNAQKLRQLIGTAVKETNATATSKYVVDPVVLLPKLKQLYTGDDDRVDVFISFMSDEVEVCPYDNCKRLVDWGTPTNSAVSQQLRVYAQKYGKASLSLVKAWGKTCRTLFEAFAQIVWPSKSKYVKTKRRCLFGIRLKQDLGHSPSNTRQASTAFPRRVSLDSLSSQSTSKSKTPLPPGIKNNRRRDKFTPYYDILENNHCYVIRVVLPLMDEGDAKGITFDCNMAKKSLNVSGSYIPGCHIGDQVIQQFGIQSPLLSVIHSPMHTTGWFDIHIPLPTDVKDDESALNIAHVPWGIAIYLPRRKTTGSVAINFSSCFGSVNLMKESTEITQLSSLWSDSLPGEALQTPSQTPAQPRSKSKSPSKTRTGKQKKPRSNRQLASSSSDDESTSRANKSSAQGTKSRSTSKTSTRKQKDDESASRSTSKTPTRKQKKHPGNRKHVDLVSSDDEQITSDQAALPKKRAKRKATEKRAKRKATETRAKRKATNPKAISQRPTRKRRLKNARFTKDDVIGHESTIAGSLFGKRYSHKRYAGKVVRYERRMCDKDKKEYDYYLVSVKGDANEILFSLSDLRSYGFITEAEFNDVNDEHQF